MNKITTTVEEVEKRLQFAIVLAMFSPVLIEALFNLAEHNIVSTSRVVFGLGASIASLIISYVLFELRKNKLTDKVLTYLNWIFFITIICYACVFLLLSLMSDTSTTVGNRFTYYIFAAAFYGSSYIPFVNAVVLILDFFIKKSKTI